MDVGRAARRRPQRHAAVPARPGPASRHPRPDAAPDPATTAPGRARPAHLARPRSDPATTTRPAEPAGRPGPAAGTPRTHLTAQPYPNEQGPLRHRPRRRVLLHAHTHPDAAATEVTLPGTRSQR